MMNAKANMRMMEARKKRVTERKVMNMEVRQQKLNTQLIEMFAKKELSFMNKYMKNSNYAINNGDKGADEFNMEAGDKKTLIAGEWRIPISEMNHIK